MQITVVSRQTANNSFVLYINKIITSLPAGLYSLTLTLITAIPQDYLHLKQCIIRDCNIESFLLNYFIRVTEEKHIIDHFENKVSDSHLITVT